MQSTGPIAGGTAPSALALRSYPRKDLFFWTALVSLLNAVAGIALVDIHANGFWVSLFGLFGVSAIVAAASIAALVLTSESEAGPCTTADSILSALLLLAALLPNATISRFAITFVGLYFICCSAAASALRRAGIIFLAISGALFWGPLLLGWLGRPVLTLDAALVSSLYGFERTGNTIPFSGDTPGGIIIGGGCSSWHGLSISLLFWVLINQWFDIRFRASSLVWLGLALIATIAVNSLRIAALANFPSHFEEIHHGYGATIAGAVTMMLVAAICLFGARREIFRS